MKYAKDDLLHIEGIIKKAPKEVPLDLQAEVYYKLGRFFKSENDSSTAKSYFKKAAEVFPDSEWGRRQKRSFDLSRVSRCIEQCCLRIQWPLFRAGYVQ